MKVLFVEDEELLRQLAANELRDAGYEVVEPENGTQALEQCGDRELDVLFTDIRLPGELDGWEIAERCRDKNPSLPVIYATGYSPVDPRPVPRSLLFMKPYRFSTILAAINDLTSAA